MNPGDVIADRYRLETLLGSGMLGTTWKASRLDAPPGGTDDGKVVVKVLSLEKAESWKNVELFEREAAILKQLEHPAIPAYREYFQYDLENAPYFVLVQEYFEGKNLEKAVEEGKRLSESEVTGIFIKLLEILDYIHSRTPPVIHRDVNPKNILIRPDGSLALVDFSGVQEAVKTGFGSSLTMIGTPGYMPLEQFSGNATPKSDCYGAAATILFLLTRANPAKLPVNGLRIDYRKAIDVSERLGAVLDVYLNPDESRRSLSEREAVAALKGEIEIPRGRASAEAKREEPRLPANSKVRMNETDGKLEIEFRNSPARGGFSTASFLVFWFGFLIVWTYLTIVMKALAFTLFSIPFWLAGIGIAKRTFNSLLSRVSLSFSRDGGMIFERRFGPFVKTETLPLRDVEKCCIDSGPGSDSRFESLVIEFGAKKLRLGEGLAKHERAAIENAINRYLEDNA